jgi:hypothetical protein
MSKLELSAFLGLKKYDILNTDSIIGGNADNKKCKCKCKCETGEPNKRKKKVLVQ